MKSFKAFVKSKEQTVPVLVTVFGKHSQKRQEKLKESLAVEKEIGAHPEEIEHKIHDFNAVETSNAVRKYSMSSSEMNGVLHTLHGSTDKPVHGNMINNHKKHIKALDDVLNNSKIHADTHVYTGLTHSPLIHFAKMNPKKGEGIVIHHPAYMSTSTSYESAKFFAGRPSEKNRPGEKHVLKLHLPQGTRGGSIKHLSSFPDENEILLHRGHNIHIHPTPTIDSDGTHVWHARVVSHTPQHIE